jgi:hypothetical protein
MYRSPLATVVAIVALLSGCTSGDGAVRESNAQVKHFPGTEDGSGSAAGAMGDVEVGDPIVYGGALSGLAVCVQGVEIGDITSVAVIDGSEIDVSGFTVVNGWDDDAGALRGSLEANGFDSSQHGVSVQCEDEVPAFIVLELRHAGSEIATADGFIVHWMAGDNSDSIKFEHRFSMCSPGVECRPPELDG